MGGIATHESVKSLDEAKAYGDEVAAEEYKNPDNVKFAQWQLPGESENYREEFLTAPEDVYGYRVFGRGTGGGSYDSTRFENKAHAERQADALRESGYDVTVTPLTRNNWKDGHSDYDDIVNPIARIRYNDRTTSDGDKMLFAEEIQQPSKENLAKMPKVYQKFGEEMAIRKMLYRAVEGGYDYFGFTTGQQQADRYDLSKQIKEIEYIKRGDKYELGVTAINGDGVDLPQKSFTADELENVVGKEAAQKIIDGEGKQYRGHEGRTLEGLDLKVGGEGLINRYDRKHVDYINKLMKPYNVAVESKQIDAGEFKVNKDSNELPYRLEKKNTPDIISRHATAEEAWAEAERLGGETIHAVRISPEFRAAVEESIKS
jgi:hypothetical protein